VSDHSPVFATFSLQISADETDEGLAAAIEAAQAQMGYRGGAEGGGSDEVDGVGGGDLTSPSASSASVRGYPAPAYRPFSQGLGGLGGPGSGTLVVPDAVFASLHPSQRPLVVVLKVASIVCEFRGAMRPPRAVSVLFPLPYEDSSELPERAKIVRQGLYSSNSLFAPRSESRDSISATVKTVVSRASKLEGCHLLLKVSLEDGTKGQAVVCMRDGGFTGAGSHVNTFLLPLTHDGLPLRTSSGAPVHVQFGIEMTAYPAGGTQAAPGVAGGPAPVMITGRGAQVPGMQAARRAALHGVPGPTAGVGLDMAAAQQQAAAAAAAAPVMARPRPLLAAQPGGYGQPQGAASASIGGGSRRTSGASTAAAAAQAAAAAVAAYQLQQQQHYLQQQQQQQQPLTARSVGAGSTLSAGLGGGGGGGGYPAVITLPPGAAADGSVLPAPAATTDPRQRVVAMMAAAKARAEAQARVAGGAGAVGAGGGAPRPIAAANAARR
jgi:hypothetical protein